MLSSLAADFDGNHAWKDHKGKGEGALGNAVSPHMRLLLVTGCFCFCLAAEREIKWEKEKAACEERIFPIEVLWLLTFEFQIYDPCMESFS